MRVAAVYRVALHLYPRAFRREYGEDMVALLDAQLGDEHAGRVVARAIVDLFLTVPIRHLEAHMSRTSSTTVVIALVALGAVLAVVGGPVGLLVAVVVLAGAWLTWSRNHPVTTTGGSAWWKLLLGGVALMAALVVVTTLTGELPSGGWYVAMTVGLTSLLLMASGLVLGAASRFRST